MNTTTRTNTRTAQIAAPINLAERAVGRTLDDLLADDRVIVDVWGDDEPEVVLMGNEAAVVLHTADVDGTLALVEARMRRGWGREGSVPAEVDVERYDGQRPDLADRVSGIFAEAKREHFATWRLIGEVTGVEERA